MKALVVDDSVVFRMAISQALEESEQISKADTASNGQAGIDYLKKHSDIDLVTLDLEMPIMDGITAIKEIRKFNKDIFILVFSSFSSKGAEKTISALSSGANDFVTKQEMAGATSIDASLEMIRESLIPKLKSFKKTKIIEATTNEKENKEDIISVSQIVAKMEIKPRLLVIGSSTGGPEALSKLFSLIDQKPTIPMLLVQHMPAHFTTKLATHLSKLSNYINVKECVDGDTLEVGNCLIAPGDYHIVYHKGKIKTNQDEKVCFVRPSLDVLVNSLAKNFEGKILSITLTGMGSDGANSNANLAKRDDYIFVQNKESSIVWGMPGAVKQVVPSAKCLNIEELALLINEVFKRI